MRILQISHAFPPTFGGVETHLWDITHGLVRRGHQVACLVGGDHSLDTYNVDSVDDIVVKRVPEISVRYLIDHRKNYYQTEFNLDLYRTHCSLIRATLKLFTTDIIHMHNGHHFAPELATAVLDSAALIPVMNSVHDRVGEHVYESVLRYSWDYVIYASRYLATSLPSNRKSIVRHLGIDLSLFSPFGRKDSRFHSLEAPIIFHPARLLRWKGILTGLEAFAELRSAILKGSLVLCDSTDTVDDSVELSNFRLEVEERARQLRVSENVHFMRFDREQMPAAYRSSDVVWYPTNDEEPFGLVPLEAMASGVPIIVTHSGGMIETVRHDRNGLIVPKQNPKALACAALRLLDSAEEARMLRSRLTEQAKEDVARFSIEAYVEALEYLYATALKR